MDDTPNDSKPAFNKALLQILKTVNLAISQGGNSPLQVTEISVSLISAGNILATVSSEDVVIGGQSFQDTLVATSTSSEVADLLNENFSVFLKLISPNLTRLNHLGLSYFCGSIEKETLRIKKIVKHSVFEMLEEPSTEVGQRWLFLGDSDKWSHPLFEIVLNEGVQIEGDLWRPHFQIDLDTTLQIEELKQLSDQYLGEDFIKWQIDIPNYGTVLAMGVLGQIGESKIVLGLGTDKRDSEWPSKRDLMKT